MRVLSQGPLARNIARALTLVFLSIPLLTGATAIPGSAQIVTRSATTQSVAVVPFENQSIYHPDTFGEEAADVVAVELRDRLLLDVLPKSDVATRMSDLGLKPPLSDVELARLASELEVSMIVVGQVRSAHIVRDREGRHGEVILAVRLYDRISQADVNGSLVTGRGPSSPDATDEALLDKALSQAAFDAVREMKTRPTVTAKVLWTRGEQLFLNVGSRGGVTVGTEMVAIRRGERIGVVKVTSSDAIGSYATQVSGAPLGPGDVLRAIYKLPTRAGAPSPARAAGMKNRLQSLLVPALILFGLGGLPGAARDLTKIASEFGPFLASALSNAVEFAPEFNSWGALLTWKGPATSESSRRVCYEIFRGGGLINAQRADGSGDEDYIDTVRPRGNLIITVSIVPQTGEIGFLSGFEPVPDVTQELAIGLIEFSNEEIVYTIPVEITYGGYTTIYSVVPVNAELIKVGEGIFEYVLDIKGEVTDHSTPATLVVAAETFPFRIEDVDPSPIYFVGEPFPNPQISGTTATFYFYAPIGANDVVIQVQNLDTITGTDPFDPGTFLEQQIFTLEPPPNRSQVVVNLGSVPGGAIPNDIFIWRIGATNIFDKVQPRPFPLDRINEFGRVYSISWLFLQVNTLTTSRLSMLHQQRENLALSRIHGARAPRSATADRVLRGQ